MELKKFVVTVAAALLIVSLWLVWLWQPERQVRLHQKHFLKTVERRNWRAMESFLAPGYSDRWGHDKATVVSACREVFAHFLMLTVEHRIDDCIVEGAAGTTRVVVKITGSGGPLAQYAVSTVNALREPFVFAWEKSGRWPWDWELARVEQRELRLDRAGF